MTALLVPSMRPQRRVIAVAVAACSVLFAGAFLFGFNAITSRWVAEYNVGGGFVIEGDGWGDVLIRVLAHNVPVLLLLFTGAISAGIGSAVTLLGVGFFVGATSRIGVEAASAAELLSAVGPYVLIEVTACLFAAGAGILPLVTVLAERRPTQRREIAPQASALRHYLGALRGSLGLLAIAVGLAVIAAAIEATVIVINR